MPVDDVSVLKESLIVPSLRDLKTQQAIALLRAMLGMLHIVANNGGTGA
jgi:hypothetical protein